MEVLEVQIWNQLVGVLSYDRLKQKTYFEYAPAFLKNNLELSPMVMPKKKGIFEYDYSPYDSYKGLPEFISDSLPDKFGTDVFQTYLQTQGIEVSQVSPLDRLAYRGNRAMGALEFLPSKSTNTSIDQLNIEILGEVSNQIASSQPIGDFKKEVLYLFELGTSPGGAQPKIILNMNKKGEIFRGDIDLKKGETSWLLKFNNQQDDFGLDKGKVEYAYYLMAKEAGINISESKLIQNKKEFLFMTKRFDRVETEKLHMQTAMAFARMDWKNKTYSYADLLKVLQFIGLGLDAKQEIFRRMVFNVLGKNVDDHTKNFSFLMNKEGEWSLAPAYDVLFTAKYGYKPYQESHFLSVNGKRENIQEEDMLAVAKAFNIKHTENIIQEVREALSKWKSTASELNIEKKHIDFIESKIS